jgi:putative transferase (TIGR04331 family)
LEGFRELDQTSEAASWPKNPKLIFTSNNFVSDDVFKFWAAKKVASGTPYFAGQHGNNYGTDKYLGVSIEEETSDRFITWGWEKDDARYLAAFNFKNVSDKERAASRDGGLLLIENLLVGRTKVWEQANEFERYMKEQFKFIDGLDADIRTVSTVRLHQAHAQMLGEEIIRWTYFDKKLKLDSGIKPIRKLWDQNKLIVHSYDSTGLLETLAANRPTLAFWQNGLSHLVDDVIPDYLSLVEVGILHLTPESAARKVNEIWPNPDDWWYSREVQKVRSTFSEKYSKGCNKPIRTLKSILSENV